MPSPVAQAEDQREAGRGSDRFAVARAGPETRTVEIDQRKPAPVAPVFVSIGTFDLDPARRLEVSVENRGTTGYVTVDAVQLVTAQGQQ